MVPGDIAEPGPEVVYMSSVIEVDFRKPVPQKNESLVDRADVNNVLSENEYVWTCSCGHPLFFVVKDKGIVCQACGKIQCWNNDKS